MIDKNLYLAHHGVKGQKWGVRRYQNYDGSYTRKGLENLRRVRAEYDDARSAYESDKKAYKRGELTKREMQADKVAVDAFKRRVKAHEKQVKLDVKADKGKALYQKGETISSMSKRETPLKIAGIGAGLAGSYMARNIETLSPRQKAIGFSAVGSILATGIVVTSIHHRKAKQLRAYYGHSRIDPNEFLIRG